MTVPIYIAHEVRDVVALYPYLNEPGFRSSSVLDQLEQRLSERGLQVNRYAKPTNARTAPVALSQQIADEVDVVIEALSD